MKVAVLWTGGKDSALACYKAQKEHAVALFVNFIWEKPSLSHPLAITKLQSEALKKQFLWERLQPPYPESYREAVLELKNEYHIEGIVTGDISYVDAFHGNWIDDVCKGTGIQVIKPLWEKDHQSLLDELLDSGFKITFTCVKEPWFTENWLGRTIDAQSVKKCKNSTRPKVWICAEKTENTTPWLWMHPFSQKQSACPISARKKQRTASSLNPWNFHSSPNKLEEVTHQKMESCRDCANLEDRRNIEGVALCAMHHGPSVCCQEFKPKNASVNPDRIDQRFCLNCSNFEEIAGIPVCERDHRPGIACGAFKRKEEEIAITL